MPPVKTDPLRRADLKRQLELGLASGDFGDMAALLLALRRQGVERGDLDRLADVVRRGGEERGDEWATSIDWAWSVGQPAPTRGRREVLPDIDVDDLLGAAPVARAAVEEAAVATTALPDLAVAYVLGLTSCALAARVVGVMRNRNGSEWRVWPHLYLATEVQSGHDKTRTRNMIASGAHFEWTRLAVERVEREASLQAANREAWAKRRKTLVGSSAERPVEVEDEIAELDRHLREPVLRVPDGPMLGRITPAQFVRVAQRSGFASALPDEGKALLENFLAGKDGREDIDALLCAFSAEPYANDTIMGEGRDGPPRFPVLHAAMVLPLQPGVLSPQNEHDAALLQRLDQRGLLARMLAHRPRVLNEEECNALRDGPQPAGALAPWRAVLLRIAGEHLGGHPYAPAEPSIVLYEDAAVAEILTYQITCRNAVAAGGALFERPGAAFFARLPDHAARLALVLAVLREGRAVPAAVTGDDAARAVRVCAKYFAPHGLAVAARTVRDDVADDAGRVLQVVAERGEVTARDLEKRLGRGWGPRPGGRKSRLEEALAALVDQGRVVVHAAARRSRVVRLVGGGEP